MNELFCKGREREQHMVRLDNTALKANPDTNMLQKICKLKSEIGEKRDI